MIYITGDTHADFSRLFRPTLTKAMAADGPGPHYVIICGDFGGVWNESMQQAEALERLNAQPFTTLFLDGNHENYDLLASYPQKAWNGGIVQEIRPKVLHLLRGQIYEIEGKSFFTMGGAACHDIYNGVLDMDEPDFEQKYRKLSAARKFFRINHKSWWAQELPQSEELDAAWENLCAHGKKVDYVLSHCAPTRLQRSVQDIIGDHTHPENALTDFLQRVYDECTFSHWYGGHYHEPIDLNGNYHVLYESVIPLGENACAQDLSMDGQSIWEEENTVRERIRAFIESLAAEAEEREPEDKKNAQ